MNGTKQKFGNWCFKIEIEYSYNTHTHTIIIIHKIHEQTLTQHTTNTHTQISRWFEFVKLTPPKKYLQLYGRKGQKFHLRRPRFNP